MILVTAKEAGTNGKKIQKVMDADKALNLARSSMVMLQPMEETSADLKAMQFMSKVATGSRMVIENTKNNHQLVFTIYNENEPLPLY